MSVPIFVIDVLDLFAIHEAQTITVIIPVLTDIVATHVVYKERSIKYCFVFPGVRLGLTPQFVFSQFLLALSLRSIACGIAQSHVQGVNARRYLNLRTVNNVIVHLISMVGAIYLD